MIRVPVSTYRIQLHAGFTFAQAAALTPYLESLGVTDVYASPFLKASPGSLHGYDIGSHSELNAEIGSDEEFGAWTEGLSGRGMGLILDFVPNHMGLNAKTNPWWRSVLTHGPSSPYASYFDIDWQPLSPELQDRVLLPILQDTYGETLERGALRLDLAGGEFVLRYFDRELPLDPKSVGPLLQEAIEPAADGAPPSDADKLQVIIDLLAGLPDFRDPSLEERERRSRMSAHAVELLAAAAEGSPDVAARLARVLVRINGTPGDPRSFDTLHQLLERQPYRLAYWRTAFDDINYRRFFDINDLGGLCMENPRVFDDAHQLVLRLIGEERVTALRIDHPDGLFDPAEYFRRLQSAAGAALAATGQRTSEDEGAGFSRHTEQPLYIAAEKILAEGETLSPAWPVAGTTGYGFMNMLNGLFVERGHERLLMRAYEQIVGDRSPFAEVAYHSKRLIMASSLASELAVLTRALKAIANADRTTRDFTHNALQRALVETVACFPIYRTYVNRQGFSASDRDAIDVATDEARRRNPVMPSAVFLFLRGVLLAEAERAPAGSDVPLWLDARRRFAMKFQQFSAPVHAKGVEDTAFYRHVALLSLNEVGGGPSRFGRSSEEFHAANRARLEHHPFEMNATSTHDSKRGEDARVRLDVISEIPDAWRQAVSAWMRMNARRRTVVERQPAPDRNDEYLYYQSLLGVWPAEPFDAPVPTEASEDFVARIGGYMQKAIKEAKRHTSWVSQNGGYDFAVARFVEATLSGSGARHFLASFVPFARRVARVGMVNALSQLVLKMAAPGVPDLYQGCETWNTALADPDNRRPLNFSALAAQLDALCPWIEATERGQEPHALAPLRDSMREWLRTWPDGRIKLFITACGLRLRRRERALLLHGRYDALPLSGTRNRQVVGLMRTHEDRRLVAIGSRLLAPVLWDRGWPVPEDFWEDTRIVMPRETTGLTLRNLLTGENVSVEEDGERAVLRPGEVLGTSPVALLVS
jgi:(1->4)-alpha-D-glucan 1-alpha-D-glucosylmutase